jgi:rhs family protein
VRYPDGAGEHYGYDAKGNLTERTTTAGERYYYGYDELNRLIHVSQNGKTLRSYGYDAFGNRSSKTEYQTAGELVTTYRYNTKNQLMQENDAHGTKDYTYDHRGNLLSVTSGEGVLRAYGFDAANQMSSSMGRTDGTI